MNNLIRFSPTSDMRRLQREIDGLFEGLFPARSNGNDAEMTGWTPRVDVSETEEAYFLHLDVPGIKKEDLEINFQDGTLSVSGERRAEETSGDRKFVRVERSYGRFYRSFTLPQTIDAGKIEATYHDGVLDVRVPKAEESKPRRISIS